jgi:ketosteroid isomerase-like protein
MDRRDFIRGAAVLAAAGAAGCRSQPKEQIEQADKEAVKARLVEWYRAFANPRVNREYYRDFSTDDYLLCENGQLLDRAADEQFLDRLPPDFVRTDRFDFRRVTVYGDSADLVYFLESRMQDSKDGARSRRWLESAVMKKDGGVWRCSLLHSTRIMPPA